MFDYLCPTRALKKTLNELVDNQDSARIRKFFKRHKNDIIVPDGLSLTDVKNKVIDYVSNNS